MHQVKYNYVQIKQEISDTRRRAEVATKDETSHICRYSIAISRANLTSYIS